MEASWQKGNADIKRLPEGAMEIACRQEVKPGSDHQEQRVGGAEDYEIEIQKVIITSGHKNKSMVIKVTDPDLGSR